MGSKSFIEAQEHVAAARSKSSSDPDGSMDLYIQINRPGAEKESNWLPAPTRKLILMLRMYWRNENDASIIDGTRTIPPVKNVA
jgi:hypothetical protein